MAGNAKSARKVRVPAEVGNPNRSSKVSRHGTLELIAGYHSYSFTGPCWGPRSSARALKEDRRSCHDHGPPPWARLLAQSRPAGVAHLFVHPEIRPAAARWPSRGDCWRRAVEAGPSRSSIATNGSRVRAQSSAGAETPAPSDMVSDWRLYIILLFSFTPITEEKNRIAKSYADHYGKRHRVTTPHET